MTIPERSWIRFIRKLSTIRDTAARKLTAYLNDPRHEFVSSRGRKAAIDYAAALADAYGESAAAVACQMYDAIAAASHMILPPAVPAPTPTYGEVAKTVNGMIKQNQSNEAIGSSIGRLVKRTEVDTTMQNAIRDGAEFAWVPNGDTCPFCIMLASNGWKRASKKTIKGDHVEHIHANCDCTFAIRFDGKSGVEGYDPDKYKQMYDEADGTNWHQKLNSMRRDNYAANADKIREQKRAAYATRRGLSARLLSGKMSGEKYIWESPIPSAKKSIKQGFEAFPEGDTLKTRVNKLKPDGNKFDIAMHGAPVGVGFGTENLSMTARELARVIKNDPMYHGQPIRLFACDTGRPEKDGDYCFAEDLANSLGVTVEAPNDKIFFLPNGLWYIGYPGNTTLEVFTPNQRRRLK